MKDAFSGADALRVAHLDPMPLPLGWDDAVDDAAPCPPALQPWIFGPTEFDEDAPSPAYAVIDAGRVPGLIDMLDTSDLAHACLFNGETARELGDTAPWLVALDPANSFVRKLTLAAPKGASVAPPWAMWSSAAVLFLRSRLDFDALRRHLRKFHLVTVDGNATHLRFWDALIFEDATHAYGPGGLTGLFDGVDSVVVFHSRSAVRITCTEPVKKVPVQTTAEHRTQYRILRRSRLTDAVTDHFLTLPEFSEEEREVFRPRVAKYLDQARHLGLQDAADLHQVALGLALSRNEPELREQLRQLYANEDQSLVRRRARIMELIRARIDAAKDAHTQGAA